VHQISNTGNYSTKLMISPLVSHHAVVVLYITLIILFMIMMKVNIHISSRK